MADYAAMSDAELLALVQPKSDAPADYTKMSDTDLLKVVGGGPSGFMGHAKDLLKSIPRGLVKGAKEGLDFITQEGTDFGNQGGDPLRAPIEQGVAAAREALPVPQGRAGKVGEAVGEAVGSPFSYIGPGGLISKVATAITGGAGSELGGQAAEGTKYETAARIAGALAGPTGLNVMQRGITPLPASVERAGLVKDLADRGVTSLTAGERTGSKTLQSLESKIGNTPGALFKAEQIADEGKRQLTRNVMDEAGQQGMATQPNLQKLRERVGGYFDDLSARNNLATDSKVVTDVIDTARKYDNVLDALQKPVFDKILTNITDELVTGGMTGAKYQTLRSQLGGKARGLQVTDPEAAKAFKGLQKSLDDAMERGLSDADKALWRKARDEYGRLKDIEGAVAKDGPNLVEGIIHPAALNRSISTGKDASAAARGQLPYSETARAGAGVMVDPVRPSLQPPTLGGYVAGPINAAAGNVLMSAPIQWYLGQQGLPNLVRSLGGEYGKIGKPSIAAIAEALRAAQR